MPVSPNLSEIVTTTLRNRTGSLANNVLNNNALLFRLNERGNVKPFSGGRTIVQELTYQQNQTYQRYQGYDVLNVAPSDVITAAEYDIKQVAVAVSISGLEELQNSGKDALIDLLESRISNAEDTMQNNLSVDCYSDGTTDGGKQIGGLQAIIADTNTNTVGGINASTWSFWRNVSFSGVTDGGAAVSAANIQSYMNRVYLNTARQSDTADLIIADNNYFRAYWESLQAIQRINSDKLGQAGFQSLKFMGADVVFDGGIGGGAPANKMYFINSKFVFLRPHRGRNMDVIGGDRMSVNQDAMVRLIGWAGNLTTSGRKFLGVLRA
ncbi:MAG: phage major capsid protein [Methylobacterium sp.]|nr:phage major capsid protein [Methylobacterium sp.]